MNWEGGVRGLF